MLSTAAYGWSGHGLSARSTGHIGPIVTVPVMPDSPGARVTEGVGEAAMVVVAVAVGGVAVRSTAVVAVGVSSLVEPPQAAAPTSTKAIADRIGYLMLIPDDSPTRSVPAVAPNARSR